MDTALPAFGRLVPTALGPVGIAWNDKGLLRVQLPGHDAAATLRRLAASAMRSGAASFSSVSEEEALPPAVAALVERLRAYAEGEPVAFDDVAVDFSSADAFSLDVWAAARRLGFGATTTYGALAADAGHPGMARETGQALGANPVPIVVPCHRILAAGGRIGGFSAPGGAATKARLLALEGVSLGPAPSAQASFAF